MTDNDIEQIKRVKLGDLRNTSFKETIGETVEPYSVVIFYGMDSSNGGSGTFVTYKGIKGILTASHVAAYLRPKYVCLPYSLRSQTIWEILPFSFCRVLTIDDLELYHTTEWKENWSENGLDISLIQLEDNIFDKLIKSSGKQFIDLEKMRLKYLNQESKYWAPENKNNWTWTIVGAPRESCEKIYPDVISFPYPITYIGGGQTKIRNNTLHCVHELFKGVDVDIIETDLGPTEDKLPDDFSGASGGGLYQTSERQVGNEFKIEDMLLAGVFVAGDEQGEKKLYSRGHIALYEIFCPYLDKLII